jgi:hypothetical protein
MALRRFEDPRDVVLAYFHVIHAVLGEFKCDSRVRYVVPRCTATRRKIWRLIRRARALRSGPAPVTLNDSASSSTTNSIKFDLSRLRARLTLHLWKVPLRIAGRDHVGRRGNGLQRRRCCAGNRRRGKQ